MSYVENIRVLVGNLLIIDLAESVYTIQWMQRFPSKVLSQSLIFLFQLVLPSPDAAFNLPYAAFQVRHRI